MAVTAILSPSVIQTGSFTVTIERIHFHARTPISAAPPHKPALLDPDFIMQHAYSIAEYLLSSGKRLADGQTIGVEGQARFNISHADAGDFVSFPIVRLNLQTSR